MRSKDWYEQRDSFYLRPSASLRGGVYVLVLLGAAGLIAGMAQGEFTRTWGSILFSLFFFFSLALGGVAFGSMQDVIGAVWGRPIKRLHELLAAFLPYGAVCLALFLLSIKFKVFSAHEVYSWIAHPEILEHTHGKKNWLQFDFMLVRDLLALVLIYLLSRWHLNKTQYRDRLLLAGKFAEAEKVGAQDQERLRYWSAPVMVLYALCYSLLAFDLTMSLAPTWLSTLWAGWLFSIMMQTLCATILIAMFCLKDSPLGHYFKTQQFHDLSKLTHGFTVFFAYLTFSHVLTYWYTNIPEETSYLMTRMERPWLYFILILPLFNFVIPLFAFIPKLSKSVKMVTFPLCMMILMAQWCTYMLVVMPEVYKVSELYLPWIEIAGGCFFLGSFLFAFMVAAQKTPMLAFADPLLAKALDSEHH
jgi:hypothetical protein